MKIPWNEQKSPLLIKVCDNYNKGILTKWEAASGLSKILRKRAENKEIEIDEVFRNENGNTILFMLKDANENVINDQIRNMLDAKLVVNMIANNRKQVFE